MSFFRRHHNQQQPVDHGNRRTGQPHMWTASASEAEVARQSRMTGQSSGWNVNVGSMMHPSSGPYASNDWNRNGIPDDLERRSFNDRNGNGIPDNLERGTRRPGDLNGNGIPDALEGGMVANQPWHKTGANSWARSATSTYVDTNGPVYPASTRSDWDHYAINHEKALLGDPIPYRDDAMNRPMLANNYTDNAVWNRNHPGRKGKMLGQTGPVHTGVAPGYYTGNGPVVAESALDARGRPLRGNYSTGTVIEDGYHPGMASTYGPYGRGLDLDHDGIPDHLEGRGFTGRSQSWGSSSLYGPNQTGGWGSGPIFRDVRDTQTPLLPDNPWTHNELGQDYLDGRGNAPTRKDRHAPSGNVYGRNYGNEYSTAYGPNVHPSGRVQHY